MKYGELFKFKNFRLMRYRSESGVYLTPCLRFERDKTWGEMSLIVSFLVWDYSLEYNKPWDLPE